MRRVLVTGASRGIGKAVALRLGADGFHVSVHCRTNVAMAQEVVEEISSLDGTADLLQFDISDREECEQKLSEEIQANGHYFGVVCNAGIVQDGPFASMSSDDWNSVVNTNLSGFYNVVQPLINPLIASKEKGRIITMSSISGIMGNAGQVNYSAAKAGIIGATKALAQELARRGITVNCIAPGLIDTDMTAELPKAEIVKKIPMRRLGKSEEVAGMASFLMSDNASYVTGQVIAVSGGLA